MCSTPNFIPGRISQVPLKSRTAPNRAEAPDTRGERSERAPFLRPRQALVSVQDGVEASASAAGLRGGLVLVSCAVTILGAKPAHDTPFCASERGPLIRTGPSATELPMARPPPWPARPLDRKHLDLQAIGIPQPALGIERQTAELLLWPQDLDRDQALLLRRPELTGLGVGCTYCSSILDRGGVGHN